jgi:hypothetical protein
MMILLFHKKKNKTKTKREPIPIAVSKWLWKLIKFLVPDNGACIVQLITENHFE